MKRVILLFAGFLVSISGTAQDTEQVPFTELKIGCYDFRGKPNEYIIQTKVEFQRMKRSLNSHPDCDLNDPEIDFQSYTLLGFITALEGCEVPEFKIEFQYNKTNDLHTMVVNIIRVKEPCRMLMIKDHWILVPKIPSNKIAFENALIY